MYKKWIILIFLVILVGCTNREDKDTLRQLIVFQHIQTRAITLHDKALKELTQKVENLEKIVNSSPKWSQ